MLGDRESCLHLSLTLDSVLVTEDGCSCAVAGVWRKLLQEFLMAGGSGSSCRSLPRNNKKFMQTLETQTYHAIMKEASQRGATVQELLRAVIIPEWLSENRRKWTK